MSPFYLGMLIGMALGWLAACVCVLLARLDGSGEPQGKMTDKVSFPEELKGPKKHRDMWDK